MTILKCANTLEKLVKVDRPRGFHGRLVTIPDDYEPYARVVKRCGRAFESRVLPDGRIQLICPRCLLAELEKPEPLEAS